MYLNRVNIPSYDVDFYFDLSSYDVYYSFSKERKCCTYFAFKKDSKLDKENDVIIVKIYDNGKIERSLGDDEAIYSLLYFLRDSEDGKSEEELKEIYFKVKDQLSPIEFLDRDDYDQYSKSRSNFLSFLDDLIKDTSNALVKKNGADIDILPAVELLKKDYSDEYYLKVNPYVTKVGSRKYYSTSGVDNLLSYINNETEHSYGKFLSFKHEMSAFTLQAQKLISFMKDFGGRDDDEGRYYRINSSFLFNNHINEFFKIYTAEPIIYLKDGKPTYDIVKSIGKIIYEETPKIIIDESGKFIFDNSNLNLDDCIIIDDTLYRRDGYNLCISTFKDEKTAKLFNFILNNRYFDSTSVVDLISGQLVPLLSNDSAVVVSDSFKEKHKINDFKIALYVDLDNDDNLIFKTEYILNKNKVDEVDALADRFFSALINNYKVMLAEVGGIVEGVVKKQDDIVKFLTSDLSELKKTCDVYLSDALKNRKSTGEFSLSVTYGIEWLETKVSSSNLTEEELDQVFYKYKRKKRFIRLTDKVVYLTEQDKEKLDELTDELNLRNSIAKVDVPIFNIFNLTSEKENFNIKFDDKIKDIVDEIKNYKTSSYKPDPHYDSILRDYQVEAFKWLTILHKNKLCGILADDMGLGKTLEMISFISSLKENKPILIVSPKSLIYNWENEIKKWDNLLTSIVITGGKEERVKIIKTISNDKKIIYITSYDSLRNDVTSYKGIKFSLMILDEAQYIKNANALKTKATKLIQADSKFVLTGTPIENSLLDLWSIFDFLMPNYLLSNERFRNEYLLPVSSKDEKATKRLRAKITPFILRRTKEEVLNDLPPLTESYYLINMCDEQKDLYQSYLQKARDTSSNPKDKISILAALTRLRQICVDPDMFLEYNSISTKLEACINLIKDAIENGHKVLVFSCFTKALDHLEILLDKEKISSYYISGKTSSKERLEIADNFNTKNDSKVALISLKAGGTGLNLIGADIVIHLDPWWNVASENQASDRAHRIGQTRPVNVIKMIAKGSIEEKVIELQKIKKDLVNDIINDDDKGITSLSKEDIDYLLS